MRIIIGVKRYLLKGIVIYFSKELPNVDVS